jgi:acetyl-CoA C-acetyltransferase
MTEICLAGFAQVSRYAGEPLAAWAEAIRATGVDPKQIDSLDVIYCQSWQYDDPAGRLAAAVGATPGRLHYTGIGGTTPLHQIAKAAERIAAGEAEVCAIVAGEALASVRAMKKEGRWPDWSFPDPAPKPMPFEAPFQPSEVAHGITSAVATFALRDIARRAARGIAPAAYRREQGELFAAMTDVAAHNPHAWFPVKRSPEELVEITADNRMVGYPYTKLMVSIMDVDLAAAVIVTTPEAAARMGISRDRLVWIAGWATGRDPEYVAEHADLARSPGMSSALNGALSVAQTSIGDLDAIDIYSCFPSAVAFALDALGLERRDRLAPFTVTGGLPYAGGAGSGYALGSVAAMADRLVATPGLTGMVTGVGMHLSKHAGVVLRSSPTPYRGGVETPAIAPARVIAAHHEGRATIAAYTVMHVRDGRASHALVVCDIDENTRCYARATAPELLVSLELEEWVGRTVRLRVDGDINVVNAVGDG